LHRDIKTANILLLEGALRLLPVAHGPPLLVHRAILSDVGLAKVRKPMLGGTTTHATTRIPAFSMGFGDPALTNSNQHSERTDAFGIGICILMSLVSEPAAGLMKDHDDDVCDAMDDGTGSCVVWEGARGRRLAVGYDPRAGVDGARAVNGNHEEAAAAARGARKDGGPARSGGRGGWWRGRGGCGWCSLCRVAAARLTSRRVDAARARGRAGCSCCAFGTARGVVRRRADAHGATARGG